MLSDSDHCYKWHAVYSGAEFHDEFVAIRLCTAREIRLYQQQTRPSATMYQQARSFQRKRSPKLNLRRSRQPFKTSLTSRKSQQPFLHRGIINALFSSTPTPNLWASPVFFVSKKNGELRLVVDYRGLTSQAQPDKLPLPLTDVLIDKMSKSKLFSLLDLRIGFTRPLVMSELFKDLQFAQVYKDEIAVHSTTLSSHHDHLRQVFRRVQKNAFCLNLSKCSFDAECIDFLGFQISQQACSR
ncbi:hypothetical protein Efla_004405 [Eimeria flavescens]